MSVLIAVLIVGLSVGLVGLHVSRFRQLSRIDEFVHIDYLYKIGHGEIPRRGELLGAEAMRTIACRNIDDPYQPPPCEPRMYQPEEFGHINESSASQHPPLYYALTFVVARGLQAVTGLDELLDTARLTGGLWLGLALLLFLYAARRLGIGLPQTLIVSVLIATSPGLLHASATVNNDASALLAGSALMLAALVWEERRRQAWFLGVLAILAVLGKVTNAFGALVVVLYLAARAWQERGHRSVFLMPHRSPILASVIGVLAALIGWTLVNDAIAASSTSGLRELYRVESIGISEVLGQAFTMVPPTAPPHVPAFLSGAGIRFVLNAFGLSLVGASAGALFWHGDQELRRAHTLAMVTIPALALGAMGMTIGNFLLQGAFGELVPRYGLSVLPAMGLALAAALRSRAALLIAGMLAAASLATYLGGVISG